MAIRSKLIIYKGEVYIVLIEELHAAYTQQREEEVLNAQQQESVAIM